MDAEGRPNRTDRGQRGRLSIKPGHQFGYLVEATCSDGTVGKNYLSLVVNDEAFAAKYAERLTHATGLPARLEAVTRPSGHLGRDVPGFRGSWSPTVGRRAGRPGRRT
ncbi:MULTISPECIES: hypothetical protein [unclassified Streptomyces]|uniref:hypothetical protein n=1 Tax=unclassified Streptomyces TaxID=2593676 RepID=UPI00380FA2F7